MVRVAVRAYDLGDDKRLRTLQEQHNLSGGQIMDEQRVDRRTLFRLIGGGAAALAVPMILPADDAAAGITWCRTDPVVTLNGKKFHIYVLSTQEMFTSRTGPTEIIVEYPQGVKATGSLLPNDNGFGLSYNLNLHSVSGLSYTSTKYQVRVAVRVGANNCSLPVRMEANRASDGVLVGSAQAYACNWFKSNTFWV